jgi:hypothetical protein
MEILDQTDKQIVFVVNQRNIKDRPMDVINKLREVTQMQHSLLGLVAEHAREELVQSVSRSDAKDKQIETLEKRAEAEKTDYLQLVKKILASTSSKKYLGWSERQSLQGVHKELENIRSKQIKLEEKVSIMEKEKFAKNVKLSSIKDLVAKCKAVQDKLEKVESSIRSARLHQMVDDTTKEPRSQIQTQEQIVERVKELAQDSVKSPQEKKSIQTSLNYLENKLEKLKEKFQELEMQESRQNHSPFSRSPASLSPKPTNKQQQKDEPQVVMVETQDNSEDEDEYGDSQSVDEVQSKKSQRLNPKKKDSTKQNLFKPNDSPKRKSSKPYSARGDLLKESDRELRVSIKAEYGSKGEKKKYFDIQVNFSQKKFSSVLHVLTDILPCFSLNTVVIKYM